MEYVEENGKNIAAWSLVRWLLIKCLDEESVITVGLDNKPFSVLCKEQKLLIPFCSVAKAP